MKRPIQKARGAILIMAVLILVVLMGIAAFALDLGRLFVLHTEMQNAVDAAVLSAAAELDGEIGALDEAKSAANQEMLNHLAHFSKQGQLLKDLELESVSEPDDPGVFTFYSWIGSNVESSTPPSSCTLTDGKCITTDYADASYVQIELDPSLLIGVGDVRYEIDLYFLPILSVFGINTAATASTRVVALAGSHTEVCDYPPVFLCDPTESGGEALNPGEMVNFKSQGDPVVEGGFGWLMPGYSEKDPYDDDLQPNSKELFKRRLGSIYPLDCSSPEVKVNTGDMSGPTGEAINTRFGIYPKNFKFLKSDFLSAPNVRDFPRDSKLTVIGGPKNYCVKADEIFGDGDWGIPLCPNQPSTFSKADYNDEYHAGASLDLTRAEYYDLELGAAGGVVNYSGTTSIEPQCDVEGESILPAPGGGTPPYPPCRMLDGEPDQPSQYVDESDAYKRRELFIAMIACEALNFGATNKVVNLGDAGTKWARFFLTERVGDPSEADVYAEFIEEVTDKDDEHFKLVIQLYE